MLSVGAWWSVVPSGRRLQEPDRLGLREGISGAQRGGTMARRSSSSGGLVVVGLLVALVAMCRGGGGSAIDSPRAPANPQYFAANASSDAQPQPIAESLETQYVATRSLNQRSAPNAAVVGKLAGGDSVAIYERRGNWVRVSPEGSPARWVSSKLLCSGAGCYRQSESRPSSRAISTPRPARSNYSDGSCPCSGSRVCIGPRGGRYCITSGGNKRYGV